MERPFGWYMWCILTAILTKEADCVFTITSSLYSEKFTEKFTAIIKPAENTTT